MAFGARLAAVAAFCLWLLPAPAFSQTPFEQQVLAMLNAARTDPRGYAAMLHRMRGYFHEATFTPPGSPVDVITEEGVHGLDEAVAFMARQVPLAPVAAATVLDRSAAMLVSDQGRSGRTGHVAIDGAGPGERARRAGGGVYVAEVIAYGLLDAADAVRQLIIDDGVADRGHRSVLFSPDLRFAGVSCSSHAEYGTMCVVDLATTPDGRFGREMRLARVDLPRPRWRN